MKERPIIFNSSMIRAILDGRKSMTRRVIKPQPVEKNGIYATLLNEDACPYGKPGQHLWARETWCNSNDAYFKADWPNEKPVAMEADNLKWKTPIFMPRWASRILLEITDIRVEKIKQISDKDIILEGFETREDFYGVIMKLNRMKNREETLNKWCWVLDFKRIK